MIVRARQGLDATAKRRDVILGADTVDRGLADQAADQRQDVADPVVEFSDHHVLSRGSLLGVIGLGYQQLQKDAVECRSDHLRGTAIAIGERRRLTEVATYERTETGSGMRQARCVGWFAYVDDDDRIWIATPALLVDARLPEQQQIVARRPGDGNGEHARRSL